MSFETVMRDVEATIRRVGWNVIGVGAGETTPGFAYTVGMTETLNHPEFAIVGGFPPHILQAVLNGIGDRIKDGHRFTEGWHDNILRGFTVPLRKVTPEAIAENFGIANRYYRSQGKIFEAFQLFLPDKDGNFPDDPGCDPIYVSEQVKWCGSEPVRRLVLH